MSRQSAGILSNLRRAASVVRLRPFDVTSADGRSRERYRRAALTAGSQLLSKVVSVAGLLVSVPLSLNYLGEERYGVWMTVSSLAMMLSFADLGIGNGLTNRLSEAHGRDDRALARAGVSSGLAMLLAVAGALLVALAVAYPLVSWPAVLKVRSEAGAREAGPAVAALVVCLALTIPSALAQRVQLAYQQGFEAGLWQCAASVIGLGLLLAALFAEAGLPWLILASQGGPVLVSVACAAYVFGVDKPWLRPSARLVDRATVRALFRNGSMFFVVQAAVAIGYQSDALVVNWLFGPEAVTRLNVPARLFWMIPVFLFMVLGPLWPAYGEALARGDVGWVRLTVRRSLGLAVALGLPATVALVVGGRWLIGKWTGRPELVPDVSLLLAFGVWAMANVITGAVAMLLNGANLVRFQIVTHAAMAVVNLGLSIGLAVAFGLVGVLYGTVLAQVLCILVPSAFYLPRLFAEKEREQAARAAAAANVDGGDVAASAPGAG